MSDKAHRQTDEILEKTELRLTVTYRRAQARVEKVTLDYFTAFRKDDEQKKKQVEAGLLDKDEWLRWRRTKMMYGKRFTELKEQIAAEILHVNETARAYVNDQLPEVYALNYNTLAKQVDGIGGYSFTLVDPETIKYLATTDNSLLPYKYVMPYKDRIWNIKNVNAEVLQAVLMGESIPKIAKRMERVMDMNRVGAIRDARTSVTAAECKGRQDSYTKAAADGIQLQKQWISTVDGRTRHAHVLLDRQTVDTDQPFSSALGPIMYPGDPTAHPANIYNCRCTTVAKILSRARNSATMVAKEAVKKIEKAKAFVSAKLKKALGEADFKAFSSLLQKAPTERYFSKYADELHGIKLSTTDSYYSPPTDTVYFEFEKHQEKSKYGILAHEMGHSFDERVATKLPFHHSEVEKINIRCQIGSGINKPLKIAASNSDEFLMAMRADKNALSVYMTNASERRRIHDALLKDRNITSGIQDAMDGFFGTQSLRPEIRLPWGHGNAYYNRFYNKRIKTFGNEKALKDVYKELGFDASNQKKVMMLSRDYEAASELWANITSAYTVGGKELDRMKEFMPSSCEEYERIMEEFKNA